MNLNHICILSSQESKYLTCLLPDCQVRGFDVDLFDDCGTSFILKGLHHNPWQFNGSHFQDGEECFSKLFFFGASRKSISVFTNVDYKMNILSSLLTSPNVK
jgi:hypothetical protein